MVHLIGGLISIILVITTTLIYYEIMRLTWALLPKLSLAPRKKVIIVVLSIFAGHTIAVWIYGFTFWIMSKTGLGGIGGEHEDIFLTYLYFSAETYSSLGLGDVFPQKGLHLLVGVEALNGLVLIGWSVAFTFIAMQEFWDLHGKTITKNSDN
ncbi:MAG: ion channel [Rickettsiales bacterium]|nr:ion channel [Pseudomonadota bacterium]MDA0966378.1 ion channel [Pseudomonadota bacterium]MDG4544011.1 ion channel [Rickettsiales bacterium]MDG4545505.1 ion channel [Rickettsiales bacterium]MDG4547954.1 ion channel [Rickettsiales bacterium]